MRSPNREELAPLLAQWRRDGLAPMNASEAADYGPQWGSYVSGGDPGAFLYGDLREPATAAGALPYIVAECLPIATAGNCCGEPGPCESDVEELKRLALYLAPIAARYCEESDNGD